MRTGCWKIESYKGDFYEAIRELVGNRDEILSFHGKKPVMLGGEVLYGICRELVSEDFFYVKIC